MKLSGYHWIGSLGYGLGVALVGILPPAWPQTFPEPDCSKDFDDATYQPSPAKRIVNLPQFGIQVTIAADSRAMARVNGEVLIVDPGTYHLLKCPGPGRGFYTLSLNRVTNPRALT